MTAAQGGLGASAGEVSNGEGAASPTGDGGSAGANPGPRCRDGAACSLTSQCGADRICVGTQTSRICVPENDYCGPEPCVQRSAGCVDHRCLPPLPLGETCQDSHQCDSGRCDLQSHRCVAAAPDCNCVVNESDSCGEGWACIAASSLDICDSFGGALCIPSLGQEDDRCDSQGTRCAAGLTCWDPELDGIEHCLPGTLKLGDACGSVSNNPDLNCGPDLRCNAASGMCEAAPGVVGGPCPCNTGLACGTDQTCHPAAKTGESCAVNGCDRGLRCADAVVGGTCCTF
jgi:hypothetical protein